MLNTTQADQRLWFHFYFSHRIPASLDAAGRTDRSWSTCGICRAKLSGVRCLSATTTEQHGVTSSSTNSLFLPG
eukprot:m.195455 g.195455  ORF g.195455 m.195455 type:complete len:74 (-) comp18676_c0_seq23:3395-3616(-)